MKKIILVATFFLAFTSFTSINAQWAKTYYRSPDEPATYLEQAYSIQQTSDGGYVVAGHICTWQDGCQYYYFLVLKLTSGGDIEWQRGYEEGVARSIQQTTDGGYIVAGCTASNLGGPGDLLALKLSSNGDIEWQRRYEGGGASSVQQTSDGGYIVAGYYYISLEEYPYESIDYWVLKLTSSGDTEWQRKYGYGKSSLKYVNSIRETNDGGYIVAGSYEFYTAYWILKLSSTGDIEWQRGYGEGVARSIQQTSDGGYIVAGHALVLKLNSNGDIEWQRGYGESAARSIQQTSDGGYIIAGTTIAFERWHSDESGFWVIKLNETGDIEWQRAYDREFWGEIAYSVRQTSDGGYIVAGNANAHGTREADDIMVLKISSNGDIDPSCGNFVLESNAISSYTSHTPVETNITPQNTNITPLDTNISAQDTDLITNLICEGLGDEGGDEDNDDGGPFGCFIATAAYGSPLHPHVETLRNFRDRYLMPSKLGSKLVKLYYKYSPFFADLIARHKVLKIAVRINLLPFVVFSYSMVHFGPVITVVMLAFILMVTILLISFFRRKLRRAKAKDPKALAS